MRRTNVLAFRQAILAPMTTVGQSAVRTIKAALTQVRVVVWGIRPHETASGLRVFLYHRIADDSDPLALSPGRFRRQLEYLAENHFRAVDVVTALDQLFDGTLPPKTVALTFDDGFADVVENGEPILQEFGFTSTVFVATDVIEGRARYAWNREAPTLDWDSIRRLDTEGVFRFEPHSLTHSDLRLLDDERAMREIAGSKAALEGELQRPANAFCFPGGSVEMREIEMVRAAGFRYAITCEPGLNTPASDPHWIYRVQVDKTDDLRQFRAKTHGSHDRALLGRDWYRRRYAARPRLPSSSTDWAGLGDERPDGPSAQASGVRREARQGAPRVAVVIPCFNDGVFVADAVASVRESEPVEIVVVDDGSTDPRTLEALAGLEGKGLRVIHQPNAGLAAARMAGVHATSAPYVYPLDADDELEAGCLARLADALDASHSFAFVYGHLEFTGTRIGGREAQEWNPYTLLYANRWGANCLYRREPLVAVGGWCFPDIYEDWDLLLALAERGYRGKPVDQLVLYYRRHGNARMNVTGHERYAQLYRQLRMRHQALFARRAELARQYDVALWRQVVYPLVLGTRPFYPFRVHRVVDRLRDFAARRAARRDRRPSGRRTSLS
jgi:glycosyltransferase involved in cell wall biosynthesis/peptidoglycan/xylan/chitin deacetylase (PgdA/CDA1 family)